MVVMLKKKMFRDIMQNKLQFITIFLMVTIGVMVYAGIESYMSGMTNAADKFYLENNLQDLNVLGTTFTEDDLLKIKQMKNVNDAERKLEVTGIDADDKDKTYLISFIESNNISKFYVIFFLFEYRLLVLLPQMNMLNRMLHLKLF
mgnify:CR=1 FL=1